MQLECTLEEYLVILNSCIFISHNLHKYMYLAKSSCEPWTWRLQAEQNIFRRAEGGGTSVLAMLLESMAGEALKSGPQQEEPRLGSTAGGALKFGLRQEEFWLSVGLFGRRSLGGRLGSSAGGALVVGWGPRQEESWW